MRLQDLNWMDVERYLEGDDRIILITGATEQHAYLSLLTDILIPSRIALAAGEREPVLIAPALNFGISESFVDFPGTITVSKATFDAILSEIVESLMHQGFRRFFILNGHGGNQQPARLTDLQMDGEIWVDWYDWWHGEAAHQFCDHAGLEIDHANWGENFPFNRVAVSPETLKAPVNLALIEGSSPRDILGDGNFGGLYQVDDALMMALFDKIVEEVVERLRRLRDL
ncbi:MAG: creatininase family protein [Anaerolineae bacterium]|nr:creatininase family protein [Anaerolineae bacterium]NUQ02992.1 creatininase family protein [Anaerolineae bacterium]